MRVVVLAAAGALVALGSAPAAQDTPAAPNPDSGGHAYPDLVLQSEKKPIRVFLQDGRNDNRAISSTGTYDQTRDWFYQNVRLADALSKKGYDVNYTWGMNRHGQAMGGAILPEMMRWLWRDHPVSTDPRDSAERSLRGPAQKP